MRACATESLLSHGCGATLPNSLISQSQHACCAPTATAPLLDLMGATPTTHLPLSLVEQARSFANYHTRMPFLALKRLVVLTRSLVSVQHFQSTLTYQPVPVTSPLPSWSSPSCHHHCHCHVLQCFPIPIESYYPHCHIPTICHPRYHIAIAGRPHLSFPSHRSTY